MDGHYQTACISVPTCAVPNTATLNDGHVTASTPGAGNRFPQGNTVTLTCDLAWIYSNGDLTRSFTCTGLDSITWTYCSGQY